MNILTIGNSFTDSLCRYLPQVFSAARIPLRFDRANFPGCELRRHWSYIKAEEADIDCRIYEGCIKLRDILGRVFPESGGGKSRYDVVSIQQASFESWREETFQPYADNLIAYIKKHAPQAEIVVQQTWAYRADAPAFRKWGISPQEMYDRLTANYRKLATENNLRTIPTGRAVQWSRRNEKYPFIPAPDAELSRCSRPDLPPNASDVVGQITWRKNAFSGELEINQDPVHLNLRGEYMQACLWFGFLTGRSPESVNFIPEEIGNRDAAFLRRAAAEALQ